jgi:protein-L-isoaspartate(D-aspartate) O-methyltransferase
VGQTGLVVSVELDPVTLGFARANLEHAGYADIVLVEGDGGLGYPARAPYDRISVTAACRDIPPPLIAHLVVDGRLIAPVIGPRTQGLVLLEKRAEGLKRSVICDVLYLPLKGIYGTTGSAPGEPEL